jgi:hypothetical protein
VDDLEDGESIDIDDVATSAPKDPNADVDAATETDDTDTEE